MASGGKVYCAAQAATSSSSGGDPAQGWNAADSLRQIAAQRAVEGNPKGPACPAAPRQKDDLQAEAQDHQCGQELQRGHPKAYQWASRAWGPTSLQVSRRTPRAPSEGRKAGDGSEQPTGACRTQGDWASWSGP